MQCGYCGSEGTKKIYCENCEEEVFYCLQCKECPQCGEEIALPDNFWDGLTPISIHGGHKIQVNQVLDEEDDSPEGEAFKDLLRRFLSN